MKKIVIGICVLSGIFWLGCANDTNDSTSKQKIFNPNGDSELALLMREMYDDGMLTRQQLLDGRDPAIHVDYMAMYTAHATEPEKVARPEYTLFAKSYESAVNDFLTAEAAHRAGAYQTMVASCMSCHQAMCPGPMVKIKKMYLSDSDMESLAQKY